MESLSRRSRSTFLTQRRSLALALMAGTILFGLSLPPNTTGGGAAVHAAQQPPQDAPRVDVVESSAGGITLDVTVPLPLEEVVQQQATTFQRLSLQGAGSTSEIGQPEVPSFARFVAIPRGARVHVEVLADEVETLSGFLLYPAQEPRPEQDDEPDFTLNLAAYQRDEFHPRDTVTLEGPYIIRGVEVVLVRFHPVQYNAASQELRIHSSLRVRLTFQGGGSMEPDRRLQSPYFEPLLARTLLNYAQVETMAQSLGANLGSGTGCDFLIITAPEFVNQAHLLADWKTLRGIDTRVRTTTQTGSTVAQITSYIQNAYDTWSPAPSFVLFLGDAEFIPTHYQTVHPQQQPPGSYIGTDLYYATVDGTDYFPDISTGRISVDTATQARRFINKIINYERSPPYRASFYSTVALAAYFQDENVPLGREDRKWVRTSEEIGSYLGGIGYDEQRIYYAEPWVDPLYYSDGSSLPPYLLRENGFPWIGSTSEIVNSVNDGRLILNHRDHGWRMMWAIPELQVSHVLGLSNGARLPVVFSINCETGWFDNETDSPGHGTPSSEVNFAEAWQRNQNGGGAGIVAPTRISYGGYNDHLDKGLIDAIWPGFLPYTPTPGPFSNPQYRMGQVLNYAKLYMATVYGESTTREITFEMFHYFGDPTMQIWTARPAGMAVSHSPLYFTDSPPYTVSVEDGALVSLVKDGEILATALSTGGEAAFTLSPPPGFGTIYLTVAKHDHRPYESTVQVVTDDMSRQGYVPLVLGE